MVLFYIFLTVNKSHVQQSQTNNVSILTSIVLKPKPDVLYSSVQRAPFNTDINHAVALGENVPSL